MYPPADLGLLQNRRTGGNSKRCLLLFCFGIRQDQLMGVPILCMAWQSKHDSQTAVSASVSISVSICLNQPQHLPQSVSASVSISICVNQRQHLPQKQPAALCTIVDGVWQCNYKLVADLLLFQITSGTPTSLCMLHTTHTCAVKLGCLMSRSWLPCPLHLIVLLHENS